MDHFHQLPPELVFKILGNFDRKGAFKLRSVCRHWNELILCNERLFPKIACNTIEISGNCSISIDGDLCYSESPPRAPRKRKFSQISKFPSQKFFDFLDQCLDNYRTHTLSLYETSVDDQFLANLSQTLRKHSIHSLELCYVNMRTVTPAEFYKFVAGARVQELSLHWLREAHHKLLNGDFFKEVFGRIGRLQIGHVSYVNPSESFAIAEDTIEDVLAAKRFKLDVIVDKENAALTDKFFEAIDRSDSSNLHFSSISFCGAERDLSKLFPPPRCTPKITIKRRSRRCFTGGKQVRYQIVPNKDVY